MRKILKIHHSVNMLAVSLLLAILLMGSCSEEFVERRTVDNPLIATYLLKYPEKFSEFSALLDTTGFDGFLKAYGVYTAFVPDNEAFRKFETRKGISSWRTLSMEQLKNIIKYSVIKDTIESKNYGDGKIKVRNMYNHYLAGGSVNDGGTLKLMINKIAVIKERDIRVDNGIIQVIDDVLEPPANTLAQLIESKPEYSIFTEALKATGWFDTLQYVSLDTANMRWFTVICESNDVFLRDSIDNFTELRAKYSNTGNPLNVDDSLNLYMAYHIIRGLYFAADLPTISSFETHAVDEVITSDFKADSIFLNRQIINNIFEPGVGVMRENSDFFAANGVFNSVNRTMTIKVRKPYPIYWDVCEQPEIMQIPGYRSNTPTEVFFPSPQKENVWTKMKWTCSATNNGRIGYKYCDSVVGPGGVTYPYESKRFYYNDVMFVNLRARNGVNGIDSLVFTTPFVPKGKYKIWICHGMKSDNRELRTNNHQVFVDNVLMPNEMYGWVVLDTAIDERDLEFLGYKRYIYPDLPCIAYNNVYPKDLKNNFIQGGTYVGRLVGEVDFTKHGSHKIKIECITIDINSGDVRLDMIHIIPSDMDQIWPKFNYLGEKIYEEDTN